MRARPGRWAWLILAACAAPKAEAPPPTPAKPVAPLARSSIAAVLEHRGELSLTDDQVQKLEALDAKREKADAGLRDELAAASRGSSSGSTSGSAAPAGGAASMGGMGGRHGGGRGGRGSRSPSAPPGSRAEALQEKLDDDDTQAFLEAEPVFTDAQREKAEDIAGAYRAQLFDQRKPAPP
jgi:hypothetical protein